MFLASNSLHNLGGQKWSCPCYQTRHLQQIHWNKIFCRMYGLGVMLTMATSKLYLSIQIEVHIDFWFKHTSGTRADWFMILHFTVGSAAAYIWIRLSAGILALEFDTCLVIGTFVVSGTFCVTSSSSVSQEIIRTGAVGTVIPCNTVGVVTTG